MGRSFAVGCLMGLLLAVAVAAAALWFVINRPAASVTAPAPTQGDIEVRVDEGLLTRIAGEVIRQEQPLVHNVVVDVQPMSRVQLVMEAEIEVMGFRSVVQAGAGGTLQAVDGRLDWVLGDVELGSLRLPSSALPESIRQQLNSIRDEALIAVNVILVDSGLVLKGITTDSSTVTLTLVYP